MTQERPEKKRTRRRKKKPARQGSRQGSPGPEKKQTSEPAPPEEASPAGGSRPRAAEGGKERGFSFRSLPGPLARNVAAMGWKEPMPVQAQAVPPLLEGRDLVVQSRTGSGKTGAFGIPMVLQVDPLNEDVQGLVLVPTRELAEQVHQVIRDLSAGMGIRTVAIYGGVGYGPQIEAIEKKVHIVVATPGRLIDHLTSRRLSLEGVKLLVLDEADEMLSMGFFPSMVRILRYLPEKRQTALFSATIPRSVRALVRRFTTDPLELFLSSDIMHVEEVEHVYYVVDSMEKDRTLLKLIEMDNPPSALIFCNTKRETEYLGAFLQNFGYDGDYISGDLSQKERDRVMTALREGKLRFLVATDVAARGIDISDLEYVVLYSLPQAHENYIHRAGRTGRAGGGGIAVSLVSPLEELELQKRARQYGLKLLRKDPPTEEDVQRKVAERVRVMLEERFRELTRMDKERIARFLPLTEEMARLEESRGVVAMLLDRFYRETLRGPLIPPEEKVPVAEKEKVPRRPRERGAGGRRKNSSRGGSRRTGGSSRKKG